MTVEELRLALIGLPGDATVVLRVRVEGAHPVLFRCGATSARFVDEDHALEMTADLGGVVGTW